MRLRPSSEVPVTTMMEPSKKTSSRSSGPTVTSVMVSLMSALPNLHDRDDGLALVAGATEGLQGDLAGLYAPPPARDPVQLDGDPVGATGPVDRHLGHPDDVPQPPGF